MNSAIHICVVTSAHDFNDDRIFHKEIKSFLHQGWKVTYLSKEANIQFEHSNFDHREIEFSKNKLRRINLVNRLYKECLKVQADVYHLHDPELIFLARRLKKRGGKVVFDIHEHYQSSILASNLPFRSVLANAWEKIELHICNKLDLLVCADSFIYKRYLNKSKIVLGNYPTKSFVPSELPTKPAIFTIAYAGGVNSARGVDTLLEALDLVKGAFRLCLIGPSTDKVLLKEIENRNYINYYGKLDWEDVKSHLSKSSIGIALYKPSINFTYCTGEGIVKIFEYLGHGLPLITSDFENLKDFVSKYDVGTNVNPTSPNQIAEVIQKYIDDSALLERQSKNGFRIVQENYNWDFAKEVLIQEYNRIK